jgi:uncharacterized protein YajQ (UPF0234 family)
LPKGLKKIAKYFRLADLKVHERIRTENFSPCVKVADDLSAIHAATGVGGVLDLQ